jgi:hypothetical protein
VQLSTKFQLLHAPCACPNLFSLTCPPHPLLLRNLLTYDIQVMILNLWQAVWFLIANDCLEGVELKPRQAEEKEGTMKIVVVSNKSEVGSAESTGHR